MKKLNILLVNIIFILLIIVVFDFLVFYSDFNKYNKANENTKIISEYLDFYKHYFDAVDENNLKDKYFYSNDFFPPVENENSKLPPIVIFGCSYVVNDSSLSNVMRKKSLVSSNDIAIFKIL